MKGKEKRRKGQVDEVDPYIMSDVVARASILPRYKENYGRPNSWNVVNGVRIEQKEGFSHDKPKFVKVRTVPTRLFVHSCSGCFRDCNM